MLPHTAAATELERTRRTFNDTFGTEAPEAAQALGAVETRSSADHPPVDTDPVPTGTDTARPDGPPTDAPSDGYLDILLIGLDFGQGRTGARNDANVTWPRSLPWWMLSEASRSN